MQLRDRLKIKKFESIEQEAVLSILIVGNMLRSELESICSDYHLNSSMYNVLRVLNDMYPKGLSRSEIHKRMLDRNPDVTRILEKLETASYIHRSNSDNDKRKTISIITNQGRLLLDKMRKDIHLYERYILKYLTRKECQDLTDLCCKICDEESE